MGYHYGHCLLFKFQFLFISQDFKSDLKFKELITSSVLWRTTHEFCIPSACIRLGASDFKKGSLLFLILSSFITSSLISLQLRDSALNVSPFLFSRFHPCKNLLQHWAMTFFYVCSSLVIF